MSSPRESKEEVGTDNFSEVKNKIIKRFEDFIASPTQSTCSERAENIKTALENANDIEAISSILENQRIIFYSHNIEELDDLDLRESLYRALEASKQKLAGLSLSNQYTGFLSGATNSDYKTLITKSLFDLEEGAKQNPKSNPDKIFEEVKKEILQLFDDYRYRTIPKLKSEAKEAKKDNYEGHQLERRFTDVRLAIVKATSSAEISAILTNQEEAFSKSSNYNLTSFEGLLKNVLYRWKTSCTIDSERSAYYRLITSAIKVVSEKQIKVFSSASTMTGSITQPSTLFGRSSSTSSAVDAKPSDFQAMRSMMVAALDQYLGQNPKKEECKRIRAWVVNSGNDESLETTLKTAKEKYKPDYQAILETLRKIFDEGYTERASALVKTI